MEPDRIEWAAGVPATEKADLMADALTHAVRQAAIAVKANDTASATVWTEYAAILHGEFLVWESAAKAERTIAHRRTAQRRGFAA